jgi:hypothetical protein
LNAKSLRLSGCGCGCAMSWSFWAFRHKSNEATADTSTVGMYLSSHLFWYPGNAKGHRRTNNEAAAGWLVWGRGGGTAGRRSHLHQVARAPPRPKIVFFYFSFLVLFNNRNSAMKLNEPMAQWDYGNPRKWPKWECRGPGGCLLARGPTVAPKKS